MKTVNQKINHKRSCMTVLLLIFIAAALHITAYAASEYIMSYLPGTGDTVTNMPVNDNGLGGNDYSVSSTVPQREGYEFLGWKLDYGIYETHNLTYQVSGDVNYGKPKGVAEPSPVTGIREGSDVALAGKLSAPEESPSADVTETYKVNYLEVGTDKVLAPQKVVTGKKVGETVTENAIDLDGYVPAGSAEHSIEIVRSKACKWIFTGWCSDQAYTSTVTGISNITADTVVYGKWNYECVDLGKNEITIYYNPMPQVKTVSYTVRYLDIATMEQLIPDKNVDNVKVGTTVKENAVQIEGYMPLDKELAFTVQGDECIYFLYWYENDIN